MEKVEQTRGLRLIIFSKFDDEHITPDDLAIEIYANHLYSIPPLEIFLYNTTGKQTTGYHYDPVFFLDRRKRPRLTPGLKKRSNALHRHHSPQSCPHQASPM